MGLKNTYQARKRFTKVPVSKTGMWYQDGDVVVPSNQITMKGPNGESNYFNSPIMGTGMQSGQTQVMYPGREYSFPNDNSVYETKMQNGAINLTEDIKRLNPNYRPSSNFQELELALAPVTFLPPPTGTIAGVASAGINLVQGDLPGMALDVAGIASGGLSKWFGAAAKTAKLSGAGRVARNMGDKAKFFQAASNPNIYKTIGLGRDYYPTSQETSRNNYQDNLRPNIPTRPDWYTTEDWDRSVDQYNYRNRPKMQGGGEFDPEFMFKNKYNTELTPSEIADFSKWAAKESQRQGRDILNDMGAYDVKGFWKSGDYKNMDSDNHGTDTWKKPNHPTFSNQSRYHGADGWYGGNWTDKAGYQPSKQTLETYGPDYYDWMFKSEPGRSEYLDMSRYESGLNKPTPFVYQKGGATRTYQDSLNLYNAYQFQKRNVNPQPLLQTMAAELTSMGQPMTAQDLKSVREKNFKNQKFTGNYQSIKSNPTQGLDPLQKNLGDEKIYNYYKSLKFDEPVAIGKYSSPDIVHKTIKPTGSYFDGISMSPIYKRPVQKIEQVSYPNQPIGTGMKRSISKNINSIQKSNPTPIYVSNPNDPRLRSYNDSLSLYNLNKNNIKDLKYIEDEYGYDRNLYDANWNKFTKNWDKTKGPKSTIAFDNLTRLNKEFPTPYRQYTSALDSRNTVFEFKKPVQPIQYKPVQKQVSYPNQQTGRGMTRTISKNVEFKPDPKIVAKQQQLIDAGYNIGTADGIWGKKSQQAWDQMSTPKQSEVNMSFETPVMKVKGMTEENIGNLKNQYKENTGSNFKSQDNVFNNLEKSLGRRPTVSEYNKAVEQYNIKNKPPMQNGGLQMSYLKTKRFK